MRTGFNMLLWATEVRPEHHPIFAKLKRRGYDGVEVPVFAGSPADYAAIGRILASEGLGRTAIGIIPDPAMNPLDPDPACMARGLEHIRWLAERAHALGATLLAGPLHQTLGHFSGAGPTADEKARAVEFHRRAGEIARGAGLTLAIEALNRFECYFVNTMADLRAHLDAVDHPNVKAMYDTFHANIEEKDPVAAIGTIAPHLVHVHISENDRGTPGPGHVPWAATFAALKAQGYAGWLTIEAFGRALPDLAAATKVWRDFQPTLDEVWDRGFDTIRAGWDAA